MEKKGTALLFLFYFYSMIQAILLLIWFLFYFSIISLFAGLVRPVYVLWFLDRMNRLEVIKIYGTAAALIYVIIFILEHCAVY